ncbi:MAG: Asp23/Gls24 family envelope stress response protein [Actinoallomurus sp.]
MNTVPPALAGAELEQRVAAPEIRGRTAIAGRVVEKIAARALTEVDAAGGAARRLWGVPLGSDAAGTRSRVKARVDGRLAMLQMRIFVVYPAPIRQVTQRLRARVMSRVGELTGLHVRQVDIEIVRLTPPERAGRRPL